MSAYIGDFRLGETFDLGFCTVTTTGAPTTLAGTPVVSAYPGNSTTEITAGITLTVDFDARTGLNNVRVVATGGNGYATATNYKLVITTGTVGGTSVVGYVVGHFSIENRSALMPTTAARTLDVSATGEGGVDWANVGTPGSTVSLSATTVATVTTTTTATNVTTVNGLAANVITAAAVATGAIDADALASDAVTEIRSLVSGTSDSGTTTTMVDAARTEADTDYWKGCLVLFTSGTISGQCRLITGFTPGTDTVTFAPATTAAVGTQTYEILPAGAADVRLWNGTAPNGLVIGRLDASVGVMQANTMDASALAADAVAEIADGVWDEVASGHVTSGTFGQRLNLIRANTAQAGASTTITLDASASAVDDFYNNTIIYLTGGTGAGQSRIISDYVGATKVATVPAWITNPDATSVFVIIPFGAIPGASAPTAAEVADAVWDEDATAHQTLGTFGQAIGDPVADTNTIYKAVVTDATGATVGVDVVAVKAETASIQTDTNDIQTRLPAALVGGRIDANVGAISSDAVAADNAEAFFDGTGYAGTGNTIPNVTTVATTTNVTTVNGLAAGVVTAASIATGAVDADALAADAVAEIADGVWDEAVAGHSTAGTYGEHHHVIHSGSVTGASTTTTIVDSALTQADTDYWKGLIVHWVTGAMAQQGTDVTAFTPGTDTLTVTAMTQAPGIGDRYIIT
jgi:hypothetical protein